MTWDLSGILFQTEALGEVVNELSTISGLDVNWDTFL